jgi:Mrp family chromosome partitioning ATPase
MGIAGGLVFIVALIAFIVVPRQATRAAVRVSATIEERPDSNRTVAIRNRAAAEIARADSVLNAVHRPPVVVPAVAVIDTFPPEARARRQVLADQLATLNRLIERADNAPLPSSYRALATAPSLANDPVVRSLLDSLSDIERERDAFGTVGGVDPVYVALTSRATAVGRSIQSIAEGKRAEARQQLAALRPAAPPPPPRAYVDTARYLAQKQANAKIYADALSTLAQMKAVNDRIDRETNRARDLANVGAPPLAMLAAALVLALTLGFGASLLVELQAPTVSDGREAEQVTGVRVLSTIEPAEVLAERSRRQADESGPPLIDLVSESYHRLYLHLAATGANVPIVTVAGDDSAIVATVASNIAAAAAYEARSTLLVDADPTTSTISRVFHVPSNPGLAGIISGESDWGGSIMQATIGRDRTLDILPSGSRRGVPDSQTAERIRADFARMERRYDLIVIAAPTAYVQRGPTSIIPGPDVVLCVRVAHTRLVRLREAVKSLRALDLRIHGLVLWNDNMPVIEAHDEVDEPKRSMSDDRHRLAGARQG